MVFHSSYSVLYINSLPLLYYNDYNLQIQHICYTISRLVPRWCIFWLFFFILILKDLQIHKLTLTICYPDPLQHSIYESNYQGQTIQIFWFSLICQVPNCRGVFFWVCVCVCLVVGGCCFFYCKFPCPILWVDKVMISFVTALRNIWESDFTNTAKRTVPLCKTSCLNTIFDVMIRQ